MSTRRTVRVVRTDDAIHATRGRWIEFRGGVWPFHIYYVLWGVFAGVGTATGLISWLVLGMSRLNAGTIAVVSGFLTAVWVSPQLTNDVGLRGLLQIRQARARTWWAERGEVAAARRAERPSTYRRTR